MGASAGFRQRRVLAHEEHAHQGGGEREERSREKDLPVVVQRVARRASRTFASPWAEGLCGTRHGQLAPAALEADRPRAGGGDRVCPFAQGQRDPGSVGELELCVVGSRREHALQGGSSPVTGQPGDRAHQVAASRRGRPHALDRLGRGLSARRRAQKAGAVPHRDDPGRRQPGGRRQTSRGGGHRCAFAEPPVFTRLGCQQRPRLAGRPIASPARAPEDLKRLEEGGGRNGRPARSGALRRRKGRSASAAPSRCAADVTAPHRVGGGALRRDASRTSPSGKRGAGGPGGLAARYRARRQAARAFWRAGAAAAARSHRHRGRDRGSRDDGAGAHLLRVLPS